MSENSYDHACNNTLARRGNVIDNVHVNNAFTVCFFCTLMVKNRQAVSRVEVQGPVV